MPAYALFVTAHHLTGLIVATAYGKAVAAKMVQPSTSVDNRAP